MSLLLWFAATLTAVLTWQLGQSSVRNDMTSHVKKKILLTDWTLHTVSCVKYDSFLSCDAMQLSCRPPKMWGVTHWATQVQLCCKQHQLYPECFVWHRLNTPYSSVPGEDSCGLAKVGKSRYDTAEFKAQWKVPLVTTHINRTSFCCILAFLFFFCRFPDPFLLWSAQWC
jgi:hypothetical protein